jgi:16S rRNA (guanine(966)-N(2))-methyltransferase RsmD
MRIVSGKYKSRRFELPGSFKARPTTDFAKENLFNILSNMLDFEDIDALDLFSGTGSIAFEIASRGASEVVAVEKEPAHFAFIVKVKKTLNDNAVKPVRTDALRFIATARRRFDFIFADPPYALRELPEIPDRIFSANLLTDNGLFVLEHPKQYDFSAHPYFLQHREYGSVNFSFFSISE